MRFSPRAAALLAAFLFPALAWAGGAIKTDINGLPLRWEGTVVYNPDKGGLKNDNPTYNHANTVQIMNDAFSSWITLLPEVGGGLTFSEGAGIPESGSDVNASNFGQFLGVGTEACYDDSPDTVCTSPILFDADGEIIDSLFGSCSKFSILGFAGFDDIEDGSGDPDKAVVRRGQALFSGACLPNAQGQPESKAGCGSCKRVLSNTEIRTIITHEIGHLMGMDHSQVNPESFLECLRSAGGCPTGVAQDIPTMFPILVEGAAMLDLHPDDAAYFQRLYGNDGDNSCSVSGKVLANDGVTEVRGVEVVARNLAALETDAISFVSGAESPKINNFSRKQGNCKQDCGAYLITGLSPGATYQLCAQKILSQFTGGSSIEPVDPPFQAITDVCPDKLTVTCDCPSGNGCPSIPSVNIVTDVDPGNIDTGAEEPQIVDPPAEEGGGGCSLAVPRPTLAWAFLRKAFGMIQ